MRAGARAAVLAMSALAALLVLAPAASAQTGACNKPAHPAGEWPSYGHDLSNSRTQPAENLIGPDTARSLMPAFIYEAPGAINNTPIVSGGCVFVASHGAGAADGHVAALDADTGAELWSATIALDEIPPIPEEEDVEVAAFGGPVVGSPALAGDLLIVAMNKRAAPFLVAYDKSTGVERWRSAPVDTQENSGLNASVVSYDGLIFQGFFGNAGPGSKERGGFAILDAATGEILKKTFVIDDVAFDQGYDGAGIWSTAAVGTETGFAYMGTSNPHDPQLEHPRSNSLLKVDLNRESANFGEIVASYKGLHDTLIPDGQKQPVCETKPDVYYTGRFSATCLAIDVDFGASPNLFEAADGTKRVGGLQKAGTYHVVNAADMSGVSRTQLGTPCFACNAASPAHVDGTSYVAAGPPGQMVAVDTSNGLPSWAAPIGGGLTYNAVSVANGLVWTVDSVGFLNGYDQELGIVRVKRSLRTDTGESMFSAASSSGVAIARNRLYVAATNYVIAYRPAP